MLRDLFRLLTVTAEQKLAHELPYLMRRLAFRLIAAIFGLGAIACLITAFWIYLIPEVGPAGAPLVIAAVLAVLALIFLGLGRRRRVIVVTTTPGPDLRAAADATDLFRDNKAAILAALFTAAFNTGKRR